MTALRCSAAELAAYSPDREGELAELVRRRVDAGGGLRARDAEIKSWRDSLPALTRVLMAAGLGDVEVLVEYQLPLTSKRIDAILAGSHPETGEDSYVVVELKAWSWVPRWEGSSTLVDFGPNKAPRLHPIAQVRNYCNYLADFLAVFDRPTVSLRGVAYLHNAVEQAPGQEEKTTRHPYIRLFTASDDNEPISFLRDRLAPTSGTTAADHLMSSPARPHRNLMAVAAREVAGRRYFTLLDEQAEAFQSVWELVTKAKNADTKTLVIVNGKPGTGKSAIALSLLGALKRQGYTTMHATGSSAFTKTMRKYVGKEVERTSSIFNYFFHYTDTDDNNIDALICDEAHRIRMRSGRRSGGRASPEDRLQIDELVSSARVPVFLLDEYQTVRPDEIGSIEFIRDYADRRGLRVLQFDLAGYFRNGGCPEYDEWVDRLLGFTEGGPVRWQGHERFRLAFAETPTEMEERLRSVAKEARITAGFCWPWSDARSNRTLVHDVQIDTWSRPWNNKVEAYFGKIPPRAFWATDPGGFSQVGCVYTAQGFEYTWSGVIIGPDLVYRNGELTVDLTANQDPGLRNTPQKQAEQLVRNAYRVLLTRGMRGTIIYATDPDTQAFLKTLIPPAR